MKLRSDKVTVGFCRKVSLDFSIGLNLPYVFEKIHRQGTLNMSVDFKAERQGRRKALL